jgi:hypothetical protein
LHQSIIKIDRASLVRAIRERTAPSIGDAEADALARTLEDAQTDDEFLTSTLLALRLIADRLTDVTEDVPSAGG